MRRIKIIYINSRFYGRDFFDESHDFFYLFGVGNLFAYELIKLYPEIDVENWRADKTVIKDQVREIDGIICRVFKGKETKFAGTISISMIKSLKRLINQKNCSIIIHFHGMQNLGYDLLSWLIPKVPVVATHHGGGNFQYKYYKNKKFKTLIASKIDGLTLKKRFDHAFVQTLTEEDYLSRYFHVSNISRCTPFGFDFNIFKPLDRLESRLKLGLSPEKKYILSVGRADHLKGVQYVVESYKVLRRSRPDIELVCVDVRPGDLYYDVVKESGAIVFGHVSYHELPIYYSACDLLVYLPSDDESLNFAGPGYVNAEALACGIPVVSSLLVHFWDESINEVASVPGNQEEVVPMICELLDNYPDPVRCREIAYKYYNWSYVMEYHLKVYNNLLSKYYETSIQGLTSSVQ